MYRHLLLATDGSELAQKAVAQGLALAKVLEARVTAVYPSFVTLERAGMRLRAAPAAVAPGAVAVALRPEKIRISHAVPEGEPETGAAGIVTDIGYLGTLSIYKVRLGDGLVLKAAVMNEQREAARAIHVNDRVWLSWTAEAGVLLSD